MSLTTGPYAIAGGGSLRIPLPRGTLVVDSVAVANLTPAPVVVTIAGTSKYVSPSGVDLFSCSSGQSYIQVTSTGTSTDAGSITTTWFDPADTPGHYPYAGAITKITTSGTITANITGPVTISSGTVDLGAGTKVGITGDVTLAAGTEVKLSTGTTVALAAGTSVKVSTAVTVAGSTTSGTTAPGFAGRTVSASSTVTADVSDTWTSVVPVPSSGNSIELHAVGLAPGRTSTLLLFSTAATASSVFATFTPAKQPTFDFQGATLGAGLGLWAKETTTASGYSAHVQLNYAIR